MSPSPGLASGSSLTSQWHHGGTYVCLVSEYLGCRGRGNIPLASSGPLAAPGSPDWLQDAQAPCTAVEKSVTKLPALRFGAVPAGHLDNGKLQK